MADDTPSNENDDRDPDERTPVFVRFSTVVGSRGSPDTVRDVRGFATKFYTEEGNWDLVGNNMPPFFSQDAMKFPDLREQRNQDEQRRDRRERGREHVQ